MQAQAKSKEILSVVIPVYNEKEVLPEFHKRLSAVGQDLTDRFDLEILYINDGSSDGSGDLLEQLRNSDSAVSLVDLSRNFGKEAALTAGIDHAAGDAVVVIDADLQDPPELIPELVSKWDEGFDVVYARREVREGETAVKKFTASVFYRLMQGIGPVKIPRDTGDFRLLSRKAVESLRKLREHHRFMKGLFAWIGHPQAAVYYKRDARFAGTTKWNYKKLWNLALEGITSYTVAPLKAATYLGFVTALVAFVYASVIIVKTLMFGIDVPGYASLMVVMLFVGGAQLLAIGIIGEYLGRMFNETKDRPLYLLNQYAPCEAAQRRPSADAARRVAS